MSESDVLRAISEVLMAGAKRSRQWALNHDAQRQGDVYETMADEAMSQALRLKEREGSP